MNALLFNSVSHSFYKIQQRNCSGHEPNMVFVLVDDWGYADVGFRNPAIKSSNFDDLAKTGLILDRHYVYRYSSPSRASFLSSRWPHHVHQWNIDPPGVPLGLNINMTTLPAKLKQAGYSTHIVGKWHEGFFSEEYLPVNRGFDSRM
jgi:arylsulfatase A-like enzyme